jgi:hypothetical protein
MPVRLVEVIAGTQVTRQKLLCRSSSPRGEVNRSASYSRPSCLYDLHGLTAPTAVQRAVLTYHGPVLPVFIVIHPAAMPRGSALFLGFVSGLPASLKNGHTGVMAVKPFVLNNDAVPACVPITAWPAT